MKSSDLKKYQNDFSDWHSLDQKCVENASEQQGAYVIRLEGGKIFGRLRGESDILYIGKTEAKRGFKVRLSHYLSPGPTQWTSKRIHEMSKKYRMEVAWCPHDEPKNLEHMLLNQYISEHDELPPLNHAGSKTLKKILSDKIGLADTVEVLLKRKEDSTQLQV